MLSRSAAFREISRISRAPSPVVSREQIATGFVVKIKVPSDSDLGSYPQGDERIPFFHFIRGVKGGTVHFYLHSNDYAFLASYVTAEATIMKKVHADGRSCVYVDLVPTDKSVTHGVVVVLNGEGPWTGTDWPIFETSEPLDALIIMTPPKLKLDSSNLSSTPKLTLVKNDPKPSATGDVQLDRLLNDGWQIDSEADGTVFLKKMKDGVPKTLIHHRPKPKAQFKRRK